MDSYTHNQLISIFMAYEEAIIQIARAREITEIMEEELADARADLLRVLEPSIMPLSP